MPAPEPPPLNDLEHLLVGTARHPGDRALAARFAQAFLDAHVGVAGRLHERQEFTPFLVGTTERHHVVAFTHPARFQRFAHVVRLDPGVSSEPLTGRQAFERLVPSRIPLLVNPQSTVTREFSLPEMSNLLRGAPMPPAASPIHQQHTMPVTVPAITGPPAYVPPGLYDRLVHYFDWLGAIDESVLLWSRQPDGREGFLLRIRTQIPPPHVLANIGAAIGDLRGQALDVRVDDWREPPWTDNVAPFYVRRR